MGPPQRQRLHSTPSPVPPNPMTTSAATQKDIQKLQSLEQELFTSLENDTTLSVSAQEKLLEKLGVALGFTPSNVSYIIHKALTLIDKKVDLDTFIYEMKNMYK